MTRKPFERPAKRNQARIQTADASSFMLPILVATLLMGFMAALI